MKHFRSLTHSNGYSPALAQGGIESVALLSVFGTLFGLKVASVALRRVGDAFRTIGDTSFSKDADVGPGSVSKTAGLGKDGG